MPDISTILFASLILLLILNVPVSVCLGLSAMIALGYDAMFLDGRVPLTLIPQKMLTAVDSFPLMAIPFFMVAGVLMEQGGMSRRLIDVAKAFVGAISGGLSIVTILASMLFAAISGSSPATVAAIGGIMIPAMVKQGYDKSFAAATQASAGCIGVIIPPSIPMITYGVVTGSSIGALFMAGFIPGLLFGVVLIVIAFVMCKRRGYAGEASAVSFGKALKEGIWAILMPVIILGGIYGGWFTPTEAANVAIIYSFIVSFFVYKELKLKDIPSILASAATGSALVMLLIATATAFGIILTREQIPTTMANFFIGITTDPFMFLIMINVMLLILGTFIETNAAIILVAPILFPVAMKLGIDPTHFGLVMIVNLAIGMLTPPLGVNLFVACGISNLKVESILSYVWKYLFGLIAFLLILTYFPSISMFLPNLLLGR